MYKAKRKYQRQLEFVLKVALIVLAGYFIYSKLSNTDYRGIFTYDWQKAWWILPCFLWLWAQNLLLDASIWRKVHRFIAPLSWRRALKTNLICYALSFITPANSGELAGRYVMLSGRESRQKTIFLTFWSHFPRLMVKFILGGSALLILARLSGYLNNIRVILAIALLVAGVLLFYLRFIVFQKWLHKRGWGKFKLNDYLLNDRPGFAEKSQLLSLATLKYLTYNFQFILLLLLWGSTALSWTMFWSVVVFYFVSAVIPTFAAADFLIKGAIALLVFDPVIADESLLINASFVVWAFNIAMPALTGSAIIFKTNLAHSIKKKFSRGSLYDPSR